MAQRPTTLGRLMVNRSLPADLQSEDRQLDKKAFNGLMRELAQKYGDRYTDVSHKLSEIGRTVAQITGGLSAGVDDMKVSAAAKRMRAELEPQLMEILDDDSLSDQERNRRVVMLYGEAMDRHQKEVFQEAVENKNPFALQVMAGVRGSPLNVASLLGSDMLYADADDRPLPFPILKSFSEGLDDWQYWAGAYGARKGIIDTKRCLGAGALVRGPFGEVITIESLKPYDWVLGSTRSGVPIPTRVKTLHENGERLCRRWTFRHDKNEPVSFWATEDHKILVESRGTFGAATYEMPLGELLNGDGPAAISVDCENMGLVEASEPVLMPTFDIEVEHEDHLFTLACGLVVSNSTADAGYFGKQLSQAVHRLVVADVDADDEPGAAPRGLPVDADDPDNEGALLATPTGGYARNTVLTPKILKNLKAKGVKRLLVRSVLSGGSPDGGIYARDAGLDEDGRLPNIGDFVGLSRSQSLSERVSQGQLCLAEGTPVLLAGGEAVPIEKIVAGVLGTGVTEHGETFRTTFTRKFSNGPKTCFEYRFRDEDGAVHGVWCTPDHTFIANNRFALEEVPAGKLSKGDELPQIVFTGTKQRSRWEERTLTYVGRSRESRTVETYDLETSHCDHLYALGFGIVTHNSSKHSGGVFGAEKSVGGFDLLDQLIQSPRTFRGGAAHAHIDGTVDKIVPAPTGGHYIFVGNEQHYVPQDKQILVKTGDRVEAGDVLSDGIVNPRAVTDLKGIGEGRRAFTYALWNAAKDAGINVSRRNIESISRGLINHVRMTDELGGFMPSDVVPYSSVEARWEPRQGFRTLAPRRASGAYLERPALHYTIGTRVTPKVAKELEEFGVQQVDVHDDPPPFKPHFVRAMENLKYDDDWLVRGLGSNLKSGLLESAHRGRVSDEASTSYVPSLARGVDFGNVPGSPIGNPKKIQVPQPKIDS